MKRAIIDLNIDPRVYTIDNFLSDAECTHLIARARTQEMQRAKVSGEKEGTFSDGRTNQNCWLNHDSDIGTKRIAERIAALVGLPINYSERFQVIKYGVGEQYRPHFDAFDPETSAGKRNWEGGGQRLITVLGYLNDVPAGGETEFPKLKIKIPAQKGKLLVFHNCKAGTVVRHPLSLHAGCPVKQGTKWAFNLWFRMAQRQYGTNKK